MTYECYAGPMDGLWIPADLVCDGLIEFPVTDGSQPPMSRWRYQLEEGRLVYEGVVRV